MLLKLSFFFSICQVAQTFQPYFLLLSAHTVARLACNFLSIRNNTIFWENLQLYHKNNKNKQL